MGVSTEKYIRKPLFVDAVRVTTTNFDDIAAWCQGEIQTDEVPGSGTTKKFIKVRVHNPKNPRQTKAFIGDWLLYTERGYKVYTNKAFRAAFDPVDTETPTESPHHQKVGAQISGLETLSTPQGEAVEAIPATPEAIADIVAEQQPEADPVPEQPPEVAAAGKRVLSQEEQQQMGPDEVREAVSSGDAVLAQDLA
jgi:hypothetical protein